MYVILAYSIYPHRCGCSWERARRAAKRKEDADGEEREWCSVGRCTEVRVGYYVNFNAIVPRLLRTPCNCLTSAILRGRSLRGTLIKLCQPACFPFFPSAFPSFRPFKRITRDTCNSRASSISRRRSYPRKVMIATTSRATLMRRDARTCAALSSSLLL